MASRGPNKINEIKWDNKAKYKKTIGTEQIYET